MLLKALEIQGFKSFPDKTKVTIGRGITAVVGPNGSGKSNISDAIRWVLGETSSKQLRGGGKMEDVIFGGTQQRSAMGYAAVSLYIDNSDRRIDVDNDEVVIGRRYYRSGDSEYSINGQNVRLKDIYELFLDTGLGRDGYSIIGQGRIAEIVGAKSGERREIFEEASGIAKYRYCKNEAERRLNLAEENLLRLRDILNELEERVGPLEKESKKAQSFLELSAQKKSLEVTLWVDTVRRAKDTLRDQQRKIEIAQADYDRQESEINIIDAETEGVRGEIEALIRAVENYNIEIRQITEDISTHDSQIAVLKNDISHNTQTINELLRQLGEFGESSSAVEKDIEKHNFAIEECTGKIADITKKITELETLLNDITAQSRQSGERRGLITTHLAEMTEKLTSLKVDAAFAKSSNESMTARAQTASAEKQNAENQLLQLKGEKEETDTYFTQLSEKLTQLGNIKEGVALKLNSRKTVQENALAECERLSRSIESAGERIKMLTELERNMDGFQHSVKTVMKAYENRRLRGIIGPVSTILTVKSGYEVAIETALGFALQNIVVENETAAKAAMAFLRDERAGRATFLPLDTVKGSDFDASRLTGSAVRASELVGFDDKYTNIITSLLGRIIVVDEINEASRVAKAMDYRYRIVTTDGQVINAGGSFTGGSVSKSAGLFSRKQEIDELKAKTEKLQQSLTAGRANAEKIKAEVNALSADLAATESEIITANGDKIRCEMELGRINSAISQSKAAFDILSAECESLAKSIAENDKMQSFAMEENQKLSKEIEAFESELSGIDGTDDGFIATRQRLSEELGELKLGELALNKDIDMHRQAIESLLSRTGEAEQRKAEIDANIKRLEELNAENQNKISAISEDKDNTTAKIEQCESAIKQASAQRLLKEAQITDKTTRVRELTNQREELGKEVSRLSERKTTLEIEYDQTIAKLWEEYELTLNQASALCIDFENVTDLRRRVGEVRGKIKALGNVNVGAIDEYAEVSQRYEFMTAQVGDVEKAKAELMRLIAELSSEMKSIFSTSFNEINLNFKRIFTELFGGGHANLSLSDEENILESGIDIEVAPPGKIIKNLSALSGGEQALVAISIYFAILAVNPAPFCILDEIEAALDDVNVTRYAQYLRRITGSTQFIVITHRRGTMEEADVLYGVTMQEDGVSKLLKLDVNQVDAHLVK